MRNEYKKPLCGEYGNRRLEEPRRCRRYLARGFDKLWQLRSFCPLRLYYHLRGPKMVLFRMVIFEIFLKYIQTIKRTILGPCGKGPFWDPARRCRAGPQGRARAFLFFGYMSKTTMGENDHLGTPDYDRFHRPKCGHVDCYCCWHVYAWIWKVYATKVYVGRANQGQMLLQAFYTIYDKCTTYA